MSDEPSSNEVSGAVGQSVQAARIEGDVHVHSDAGRTGSSDVPRQLPGAARHFVNRAVEQDALSTVLSGAGGEGVVLLSTIDGTAGVGKSTLAVQWAHQRREHFADGELYVNLRGFDPAAEPMSPVEVLGGFLVALGIPSENLPEDEDARAAWFRSAVHGKRMLVLLDNARSAEQVRPLLPASPDCLVLVTSRNRLGELVAREGATRVSVQVLDEHEANELLFRYLGQQRLDAEPESARTLVEHCARLPLALGMVAVRVAEEPDVPLSEAVSELRDERERLDALDAGGETGVRAVFSWSYGSLSPESARAFRLLGLPTGPDISTAAARDLLGTTHAKARSVLTELTRAHLLDRHQRGRYRFHDLLRAYAAECADKDETPEERNSALRRLIDHYLRTSTSIQEQLVGHSRPFKPALPESEIAGLTLADDEAMQWWADERENLAAAIHQASRLGLHEHASQLPYTLMYFYKLRGHTGEALTTFRLALDAVRQLDDRRAEAHLLHDLANAHYFAKDIDTAVQQADRAVGAFEELGDRGNQGQALIALGIFHVEGTGNYGEASKVLWRALDIAREVGDKDGEGQAHDGIACLYNERAEFDKAPPHFEEALRCYRETGEKFGAAFVLNGLGNSYFGVGRWSDAVDAYQQAVALRAEIGHVEGQARSSWSLGQALLAAGDASAAREKWELALARYKELGQAHEVESLRADLDQLPNE